MKKLAVLFILLASFHFAQATPFRCQPEALRKSQHSIFYNPKNGSLWISVSDDATNVFSALGFRQIQSAKEIPAKGRSRTPMNSYSCPLHSQFLKSYGAKNFSLFVGNSCTESLAKNLGFTLKNKIHKSAATEYATPLPWSTVGLCTDGKTLYHCGQPTKEMQACIKTSEKLLLQ